MGLDVVFYTEGLEFDGVAPFERAIGGSETAVVCMARELARLGHNVKVYCRCPRPGVYEYEGEVPVVPPTRTLSLCDPAHRRGTLKSRCIGTEREGSHRDPEGPREGGEHRQECLCHTGLVRVEYEDLSGFGRAARVEDWDVLVCSRFVRGIAEARLAKRCVLWGHDVLTEETAPLVGGLVWRMDRIFVLSEFQKRQWQGHLSMAPDSAFFVTRNGVDLEVVDGAMHSPDRLCHIGRPLSPTLPHDGGGNPAAAGLGRPALQKRVIYASRPERGLEVLLEMWPELKRRHPDLELVLCRYDHPAGDAEMAEFLAHLERRMEKLEGITFLGGLSKAELYEAMKSCQLMLYPSIFPEVSCISALEAAACRIPIVASKYCALKETVADGVSGILIGGDPSSREYQERFIEAADALLSDETRCKRMGEAARRRVEREYRWANIAREWSRLFGDWFARVPAGKVLAHLKHNSDLVAARDAGLASAQELGIEWLDDEVQYRRHYEEAWERSAAGGVTGTSACATQDAVGARGERAGPPSPQPSPTRGEGDAPPSDAGVRAAAGETPALRFEGNHRFGWLVRHVRAGAEIRSVLDVGCGSGEFAVGLANEIPGLRVVGTDVSEAALARARLLAAEHAKDIGRVSFTRWPPGAWEEMTAADASERDGILRFAQNDRNVGARHAVPLQDAAGRFDAVFLGELLEHVPDVEEFVARVEAALKPGGWMFATLPFGPWESMSLDDDRRRGIKPSHVRGWGYRDVIDVFGKKAGLDLCHAECGATTRGEPVGHWLLAYRAVGETGRYDYARKLRCNPRHALSVCMIVGGAEAGQTLHRCLHSVRPIADEIVIAWSNCDEETLRIARQYAHVLFEIAWLEEDGLPNFAAARNRSIEKASGDWILWIDADEYLVGAENLPKYLRENIYNAYVIRQWHHAIDASFAPDTPMRCFRNGLGVKFFGAIHEHPEMALNEGITPHVILADVNVIHDGYVTEGKRVGRFRRNLPILVKDRTLYPERRLGYLFWLRDLVQSARHQMMACNGMTRQAMGCLEEAVRLYRERFADPGAEYHAQARPLYQQALMLLGRGRPLQVTIARGDGQAPFGFARGEQGPAPTGAAVLFGSAEEAAGYAAACARQALAEPPWAREFAFER